MEFIQVLLQWMVGSKEGLQKLVAAVCTRFMLAMVCDLKSVRVI
jgi:hypothetical protein